MNSVRFSEPTQGKCSIVAYYNVNQGRAHLDYILIKPLMVQLKGFL